MQPAPNIEQQRLLKSLPRLLSLVSKNIQTWVDLFAEDAVFESPYAPGTRRIEQEAICNFITRSSQMQDLMFTNIRVYQR